MILILGFDPSKFCEEPQISSAKSKIDDVSNESADWSRTAKMKIQNLKLLVASFFVQELTLKYGNQMIF